jgi:diphthamide synthase (EF-2-diphthine--ammonia ligase)
MSWSSGKDSAFALEVARRAGEVEVVGLLTTVNSTADRVAMHAVRRELLEAQAAALGLPLHVVDLPWPCPNEIYEQRMSAAVAAARDGGVERMVFGDLYLPDVREYRERMLEGTGIAPVFPLWLRDTRELAAEMVASGLRAVLTCVDPSQAPGELV